MSSTERSTIKISGNARDRLSVACHKLGDEWNVSKLANTILENIEVIDIQTFVTVLMRAPGESGTKQVKFRRKRGYQIRV